MQVIYHLKSEIQNRECFMQTTMASSICPLCKNPSGLYTTAPLSRLCNECRSMLSTILPQAVAGSVVIVDAQKTSSEIQTMQHQNDIAEPYQHSYGNEEALVFETKSQPAKNPAEHNLQSNAPVNGNTHSVHTAAESVFFQTEEQFASQSSTIEETKEAFYFQTEEKPKASYLQTEEKLDNDYAAYLQAAQQFDAQDVEDIQDVQAEEKFDQQYVPVKEKIEDIHLQPEERIQHSVPQFGFVNPPHKTSAYVDQLEKEPEMQSQGSTFVVAPEPHQQFAQENLHSQQATPQQFYMPEPVPTYTQEPAPQQFYAPEAALPYAPESNVRSSRPLPEDAPDVWDSTVDNYPVLIVQEEKRTLSKPLLAFAAMALLALVAAGYWFVYKPLFGGSTSNASQRTGNTVENNPPATPETAPVKTPENNSPASQPQTPANAAAVPPTQATPDEKPTAPSDAAASNPEVNGQGKISLQAASFPSEQAANEFSEKLIRSGVPAYIASANIAGKGKWYRVRVGRFPSAADAEKYAAQAKQRAKATGLNLQLVICDYTNQ
jgi:cell division septation protein DedD